MKNYTHIIFDSLAVILTRNQPRILYSFIRWVVTLYGYVCIRYRSLRSLYLVFGIIRVNIRDHISINHNINHNNQFQCLTGCYIAQFRFNRSSPVRRQQRPSQLINPIEFSISRSKRRYLQIVHFINTRLRSFSFSPHWKKEIKEKISNFQFAFVLERGKCCGGNAIRYPGRPGIRFIERSLAGSRCANSMPNIPTISFVARLETVLATTPVTTSNHSVNAKIINPRFSLLCN